MFSACQRTNQVWQSRYCNDCVYTNPFCQQHPYSLYFQSDYITVQVAVAFNSLTRLKVRVLQQKVACQRIHHPLHFFYSLMNSSHTLSFFQILQGILHNSLLDKWKTLSLNLLKAGLNIFLSNEKEKDGITKKREAAQRYTGYFTECVKLNIDFP